MAGGKGTRLLPLTLNVPKPMVQVAGQPFLYWQLRYLQEQGVKSALLLVSHLAHVICDHFDKHPLPGLTLDYSVEPQPMGTGGALLWAKDKLSECFWLLNGDSFLYLNLPEVHESYVRHRWEACLTTVESRRVGVPGNVRTRDDSVLEYKRDAGFALVDAGLYLISKSVVMSPTGESEFDLGQLWAPVVARGSLGYFSATERFFDIGTIERLRFFETHIHNYFRT